MGDEDDFDPEIDLLNRYESMVETQIETLNGIDEKAARIMRIIPLLLGGFLTAFSILITVDGIRVSDSGPVPLIVLAVGLGTLLLSLGYSVVTYLGSVFEFGPTVELGRFMSKYQVGEQEYRDRLLNGYSNSIQNNRQVVNANSRRFRRSLLSFLCSMTLVSAGITGVVVDLSTQSNLVLTFLLVLGLIGLIEYVEQEEYLTLERQHGANE